MISALTYCHENGIAHRDLKPENLLIDNFDNVKISDFGLSALTKDEVGKKQILQTTCGTPNYVAPEVIKEQGYDGFLADIWSAGVILFVMCSGCLPFEDDTMNGLFEKIFSAKVYYPKYFSKELKVFISKMLVVDPSKRITIKEILEDEWFKVGYKSEKTEIVKVTEELTKNAIQKTEEEGSTTKQTKKVTVLTAFDLANLLLLGSVDPFLSSTKIKRETRFMAKGNLKEVSSKFMETLTKMKGSPSEKKKM